jgi:hypothetical protein
LAYTIFQVVHTICEGKIASNLTLEEGDWWENELVYKMHYQVTLEDWQELGIFRNYKTGSWYRF